MDKRAQVLHIKRCMKDLVEARITLLTQLQAACAHENVVELKSKSSLAPSYRICCYCSLQTIDRLTHPAFGALAAPNNLRQATSQEEYDSFIL